MAAKLFLATALYLAVAIVNAHGQYNNHGRYSDIMSARDLSELSAVADNQTAYYDAQLERFIGLYKVNLKHDKTGINRRGEEEKEQINQGKAACRYYAADVDKLLADTNATIDEEAQIDVPKFKQSVDLVWFYQRVDRNAATIKNMTSSCQGRCQGDLNKGKRILISTRNRFPDALNNAYLNLKGRHIERDASSELARIDGDWRACINGGVTDAPDATAEPPVDGGNSTPVS